MILFFDTETTGFVDDRLPPDHQMQPDVVQLAAQLCDEDGAVVSGINLIVTPARGLPIPKQASDVHGITDEIAGKFGVAPSLAVDLFHHLYSRADLIVAHNIKFDAAVMETAIVRAFGHARSLKKPRFCTMETASPIVNLPPTDRMRAAGFNKPKPPKLEECVRHFFNEGLEGAHDAMIDVTACARVYFHLKSLEREAA